MKQYSGKLNDHFWHNFAATEISKIIEMSSFLTTAFEKTKRVSEDTSLSGVFYHQKLK